MSQAAAGAKVIFDRRCRIIAVMATVSLSNSRVCDLLCRQPRPHLARFECLTFKHLRERQEDTALLHACARHNDRATVHAAANTDADWPETDN